MKKYIIQIIKVVSAFKTQKLYIKTDINNELTWTKNIEQALRYTDAATAIQKYSELEYQDSKIIIEF